MKFVLLLIVTCIQNANCLKQKSMPTNQTITTEEARKNLEKYEEQLLRIIKNRTRDAPLQVINMGQTLPIVTNRKKEYKKMITPDLIEQWAKNISTKLLANENRVVNRQELLNSFYDVKSDPREVSSIVERAGAALTELLQRRADAAEAIMRRAEIEQSKASAPQGYAFDYSFKLGEIKKIPEKDIIEAAGDPYGKLLNCRSQRGLQLKQSAHFDARVTLNASSVHVSPEVYDCDDKILNDIYWSENLDSIFRDNYRKDASLDFQYFCSAQGYLRHYPAASWESLFKISMGEDWESQESAEGVYDCRLRPWYVSASGAPRDVLVLLDASGSMYNSSNKVIAEHFTQALLNALTDDDQVNVLRFNRSVSSPIKCFDQKLVSANHINTAAMMTALKLQKFKNDTNLEYVLTHAVKLLQKQRIDSGKSSCQQAIILVTDNVYDNFTDLMRTLDPSGEIRVFVMWLHDQYGLRDNTPEYSEWLSCSSDGFYSEMVMTKDNGFDVTEQVMRILRVLERPLVLQRKYHKFIFSDLYAHVEDPRRSDYLWSLKERQEQLHRYNELREDKEGLLNGSRLQKDFMHQYSLDEFGQYYEGEDVNFRLQISVSVPVFEDTTEENITITLSEELQRNSTRTYPVNRLLGVAGVDIPIDHLKIILPYYQLGSGGYIFIVDDRGNIILHDNLKPTFNGDILKPGYRTVDLLDLEQAAVNHPPRKYVPEWVKFRNNIVVNSEKGSQTLSSKYVYEYGMRVFLEDLEYSWKRIMDHYTIVVALPKNRRARAVPNASVFTQKLAEEAINALTGTDFAVHPDWLYCRYVHQRYDTPEEEILEFIRRRANSSKFVMKKLEHFYSTIPQEAGDLGKTYQCEEELIARVCRDAVATAKWARKHESTTADGGTCTTCDLGSTTAFFATESGLTRWQQYHATSAHADPPAGSAWPRGPTEPYYVRAVANPNKLIVHAPVAPVRRLRNTFLQPPSFGVRSKWLTAARAVEKPGTGIIGVAGYHFYPQHLEDLLEAITNFPYPADEKDLHVTCDGEDWSCLVIDEGGWVVAGAGEDAGDEDEDPEEPVRPHLATLHPYIMTALLEANVFELNWIHDYQGVCLPPAEEKLKSAGHMMPSFLRSMWHAITAIIYLTKETVIILMLATNGGQVMSETAKDIAKRQKYINKQVAREKFDRLFDPRVLVNRTRITVCDRSRPLYVLNHRNATEAFKRPMSPCKWPLVGAFIPETNLILLAIFRSCRHHRIKKPPVNPMQNIKVDMNDSDVADIESLASRLACWRNRVTLPTRAPNMACFKHNYSQEAGYRQCGPWLPNPEVEDVGNVSVPTQSLIYFSLLLAVVYYM